MKKVKRKGDWVGNIAEFNLFVYLVSLAGIVLGIFIQSFLTVLICCCVSIISHNEMRYWNMVSIHKLNTNRRSKKCQQ